MQHEPIQVLIVDDSALMRSLIGKIIERAPGLALMGTALNGAFALKKLALMKPDVIVLDLEMPEMNGIEFLKKRRELRLDIPVIILSSVARKGAEITMEALNLGASDFIRKPSGSVSEDIHVIGDQLVELIRVYGGHKKGYVSEPPPPLETTPAIKWDHSPERREAKRLAPARAHQNLQVLSIGISTGGPNALRQMFQDLEADFPLPILVVQHMPAGFTFEFAKSLSRICPLEVKEAEDGDLIRKGRILIAPGDHHMIVEKRSLANVARLHQDPQVNGHRPSAGVLFQSVAKTYGPYAMGLIMTGMGRDGAAEIGEIYAAGGLTAAQDEGSCVVYGMPRVALEMGNIERVIPLEEMARQITEIVKD